MNFSNQVSFYEVMSIYLVQQHRKIRIQLFDLTWLVNKMFRVLEQKVIPSFAVYYLPFALLW